LAQFFTTIFEDGFESGDFSNWTGNIESGGSNSIDSSNAYEGNYCLKGNLTSNADLYLYKTLTRTKEQVNLRAYVKIDSITGAGSTYYGYFMGIRDTAGGQPIAYVGTYGTNNNLYLWYWDSGGSYKVQSSTTFPLGEYHCVELQFIPGAGTASIKVFFDGSEVTDLTQTNLDADFYYDTIRLGTHCPGSEYSSGIMYFDCVVVADTYIGEEGEVTEVQVLDSAAGTEAISRPYRFFSLTDTAFGQEVMLKTRNLSLSDVAIGLEILRKARNIGAITDTAQGLEQILKQQLIKLLDQAAGSETIARPTRIIIMVDEALSQEIIGKLREIAAITDSAIGMEYISAGKVGESIKTKIFLFIGDLAIQVTGD